MGDWEILLLGGFVFLFLLMADHGRFTFKAFGRRLIGSRSRAKVLPFGVPAPGMKKPVKSV